MKKQVERQTVEIPVLNAIARKQELFFAVKQRTTGSVKNGNFIKLPFGAIRGDADIRVHIGNDDYGYIFYVECKSKVGRQSTFQKAFEHKVKKHGTRYYIVSEASQIEDILKIEEEIWRKQWNCLKSHKMI